MLDFSHRVILKSGSLETYDRLNFSIFYVLKLRCFGRLFFLIFFEFISIRVRIRESGRLGTLKESWQAFGRNRGEAEKGNA